MNASQFPGQTLAPVPGINAGEDQYSVLQKINQLLFDAYGGGTSDSYVNTGGFTVPAFNDVKFTYYGSTNNIKTQKFYSNGVLVTNGTLTYSYAGGGAANDDLITDIQQS